MKILITGGCGYKGSVIIPLLLNSGHKILNIDNQWFGNHLKAHTNLINIKSDIRTIDNDVFRGVDSIIHLANIANDPAVDLNPSLSWEVNVLASKQIADFAIKAKVKQIIYASSGSVYGIKEEKNVTEELNYGKISGTVR